jgi:hypothetical protein
MITRIKGNNTNKMDGFEKIVLSWNKMIRELNAAGIKI